MLNFQTPKYIFSIGHVHLLITERSKYLHVWQTCRYNATEIPRRKKVVVAAFTALLSHEQYSYFWDLPSPAAQQRWGNWSCWLPSPAMSIAEPVCPVGTHAHMHKTCQCLYVANHTAKHKERNHSTRKSTDYINSIVLFSSLSDEAENLNVL